MDPTTSSSRSVSVHVLIANASVLFGTIIFIYQAWSGAPLGHVLFTAATSGLVSYLTLAVGFAGSQYIVTHGPDSDPAEDVVDVDDASAESSTADTEPDDDSTMPEPRAA
ncbi:MAG: hypothetical protein ABEK75_10960 [Salinibacter sp.]